jgi:TrmH family RNA methyltransferase
MILEALSSGAPLREIFIEPGAPHAEELMDSARSRGVPVHQVTGSVAAAMSDTVTPQGAIAVSDVPVRSLAEISDDPRLVLVLADVRDPGNAGTLMRSAVAAGADAVVFCEGSVDPFNPKTVRAAAGSLFRARVVSGATFADAVEQLRARHLALLGADARAGTSAFDTDLARPLALVMGNEAWGLADETRSAMDELVGIPMPGGAESLNVGIAGSILLFEAVRQRGAGSTKISSSS